MEACILIRIVDLRPVDGFQSGRTGKKRSFGLPGECVLAFPPVLLQEVSDMAQVRLGELLGQLPAMGDVVLLATKWNVGPLNPQLFTSSGVT